MIKLSSLQGNWDIRHKEAEQGRAVYCDATNSGPLRAVRSEDGGEGVSAVVGTCRSIFVGGEEKGGSGKIGQRGDDRRGGGNSPGMTTGQE